MLIQVNTIQINLSVFLLNNKLMYCFINGKKYLLFKYIQNLYLVTYRKNFWSLVGWYCDMYSGMTCSPKPTETFYLRKYVLFKVRTVKLVLLLFFLFCPKIHTITCAQHVNTLVSCRSAPCRHGAACSLPVHTVNNTQVRY